MLISTDNRIRQGVARRVRMLQHHGNTVWCPVCGHHFSSFKDRWNRDNAVCWRCRSHERHRALCLLFDRRPELLSAAGSMLHFAPEWSLQRRLKPGPYRYVTADLDQPGVDLYLDITDMRAVRDAEFDAVLCSHVLEHVPDDGAAMRELRRITAPGGWCMVLVPIDLKRSHTYEDPTITDPRERERAFWQFDHVRVYAQDIEQRFQAAGFEVERIAPRAEFGSEMMDRCRLLEQDLIWVCRPQADGAAVV